MKHSQIMALTNYGNSGQDCLMPVAQWTIRGNYHSFATSLYSLYIQSIKYPRYTVHTRSDWSSSTSNNEQTGYQLLGLSSVEAQSTRWSCWYYPTTVWSIIGMSPGDTNMVMQLQQISIANSTSALQQSLSRSRNRKSAALHPLTLTVQASSGCGSKQDSVDHTSLALQLAMSINLVQKVMGPWQQTPSWYGHYPTQSSGQL